MDRLDLDTPDHVLNAATADIESLYILDGISDDLIVTFRVWDSMYRSAVARDRAGLVHR